jgi:hypothetical protein
MIYWARYETKQPSRKDAKAQRKKGNERMEPLVAAPVDLNRNPLRLCAFA